MDPLYRERRLDDWGNGGDSRAKSDRGESHERGGSGSDNRPFSGQPRLFLLLFSLSRNYRKRLLTVVLLPFKMWGNASAPAPKPTSHAAAEDGLGEDGVRLGSILR